MGKDGQKGNLGSTIAGFVTGALIATSACGIAFVFHECTYLKIAEAVKDYPVLNILFELSDEQLVVIDTEKLKSEVSTLKVKVDTLESEKETLVKDKDSLTSEVNTLKKYEEQFNAFEVKKTEWETGVLEDNRDLFKEILEEVSPEKTEALYKEIVESSMLNDKQKEYAKVIGNMDDAKAASVITDLLGKDKELAKVIISGIGKERQSAILSAVDTSTATEIIKLLYE